MSDFTDLVDAIKAITKRPELDNLTKVAARLATLRAHQVDFFPRDLTVVPVSYTINPSALYIDIPNLETAIPKCRSFDLIQGVDATTGLPVENLEWREYKDFWLPTDGTLRQSVYTRIGDTLRMIFAMQTSKIDVLYYKNPNVTDAGYSSWIYNDFPDDIAQWAAGIVWQRSGNTEQAKMVKESHVDPFRDVLVSSSMMDHKV